MAATDTRTRTRRRAKLAAEQRRCTEQTELCAGANAKVRLGRNTGRRWCDLVLTLPSRWHMQAQAMAQELELKDAQMATLRERVTELELQLAAAGSTGAGAGDDDDGGGFEAALREEMDSMRASYKKVRGGGRVRCGPDRRATTTHCHAPLPAITPPPVIPAEARGCEAGAG